MNGTAWAAVISAFVVGVPSFVIGLLAWRGNLKSAEATNNLERDKLDVSVFTESIADLRASLADLREQVDAERMAREAAEERAKRAEARADAADLRATEARRVVGRLTARVSQLEKAMRDNGMTVPPEPKGSRP